MKIKIPTPIQKLCLEFATNCVETNIGEYRSRNQRNVENIISQIYEGKIAEWAVYMLYSPRYRNLTEPDMKIYSKFEKSFEADLFAGNLRFHVKSQNLLSVRNFGKSFLLQKKDPLVDNPNMSDMIIYCIIENDYVKIDAELQAFELQYSTPKLACLRETKVAYYLD